MPTDRVTLEGRLVVSYKLETVLPFSLAVVLLGIYPTDLKTIPVQNGQVNVCNSFNCKCPKPGATKKVSNRRIVNLWYIYTMEYYSAIKRNELSLHEKIHIKLISKCWVKEWRLKRYIPFDSKYMTFWERQNYRGVKNIRGCQRGERWRGLNKWSKKFPNFFRVMKLFYIVMVSTWHCALVKSRRTL